MNSSKPWLIRISIATLLFFIGGLVFWAADKYLITEKTTATPQIETKAEKKAEVPKTTNLFLVGEFKPIPKTDAPPKILSVSKDDLLRVYDPATKKISSLVVKTGGGGATLYQGSSSPILSSSKKRIAYLNEKDGEVWVIDTSGEGNQRISDQNFKADNSRVGSQVRLSGWSSNERYLVYYVDVVVNEYGVSGKGKVLPPVAEGIYVADLEKGKIYYLPNMPNFVGFLPKSNLGIFLEDDFQTNETTLYTLDVANKEIKKLTKNPIKGSLPGQYHFSSDGKNFVYMVGSETGTDFARMIYTNIDNTRPQEILRVNWAEVQRPHLSPDKKYIAYLNTSSYNCPEGGTGCRTFTLFTYDLKTKKTKKFIQAGNILYWYSKNEIVVISGKFSGPRTSQLVNVDSGKATKISDNERSRNR